jgi:Fe-S oxidoreductase
MRREKRRRDPLDYAEHAGLLAYEKRGTSQRFTYYAIPAHCDTVFFPGCALAGTRSGTTLKIYDHLKNYIPSLGIVLDCCLKISHDLGREDHFRTMFREMKDYLVQSGVKKIIVACPNCHRIFSAYGEELAVSTVYEIMDEHPLPVKEKVPGTVTVHDPCPMRFSPAVHASVRSLVAKQGLTIEEMPHHGESTVCCGEGGFVTGLSPDLVAKWKEVRSMRVPSVLFRHTCSGRDSTVPALLWQLPD